MSFKALPSALCSSYLGPQSLRWGRYLGGGGYTETTKNMYKRAVYFWKKSHNNIFACYQVERVKYVQNHPCISDFGSSHFFFVAWLPARLLLFSWMPSAFSRCSTAKARGWAPGCFGDLLGMTYCPVIWGLFHKP